MRLGLGTGIGFRLRGNPRLPTPPAIFTDNQWALVVGPDPVGDKLIVDILNEPLNGGRPILRYEYRLNGGAAITLPGGTALGAREITVVLLTEANIEIRAINDVSDNPDNWSAVKTMTPQINGGTTSETLTFDGAALSATGVVSYGTYADGSYWINGGGSPVTVTGITPASTTADRTIDGGGTTGVTRVHGTMIDPGNAARYATGDVSTLALRQQKNYGFSTDGDPGQGYDEFVGTGNTTHRFTSSLNVDPGFTGVPIVLTQGTIVKAVSKSTLDSSLARPALDKLVPFTIVSSAPPANSFRPATASASKVSNWTTADLNMARLPNLTPTGVTVPDYATTLARLRYQSWQHTYNVNSRNIVPDVGGAPVYGGDFWLYTEAMLGLCYSTWTTPQKTAIATMLVQFAIDIAGRAVEGGIWQDNGGHCTARKSLLTFAAYIMNDDPILSAIIEYKALGVNYTAKPTPVGASIYGEDTQHRTITQAMIDEPRFIPYTQDQLGWPEWGGDATREPTSGMENHLEGGWLLDPSNNKTYRRAIARVNVPAALALRLMGAKDLFNNQVFFDYCDRHMQARIAEGAPLSGDTANDISAWVLAAWQLSRGTLGLWPQSEFFTVAILGQSQPFYITSGDSFYNSADIPRPTSISTQNAIMVDRSNDLPRERPITDSTVAARQINMGIVVLADLFGWAAPERKLVFKQMARSGTGRDQYMNDDETERLGSVDDAIANYKTDVWGDVNLVFEYWNANDDPTFPNFLREWAPLYLKQRWTGEAFTTGNTNPDSARNPLDRVDRHFWDVTVPENQKGAALWSRNTKMAQMPAVNSAAYAGFDAFLADSRVQTFAHRALGEWDMHASSGKHALRTTPDGQVYAAWALAPSIANALGIDVFQPSEYRVEVGPSGAYADIFIKLPNGGNLTTFRINESRAAPSVFLPHQQEVTGVEIRRVGDTQAQRQSVFRLSETTYPSKYRGTVTLHNAGTGTVPNREGVIRVTPLEPFVDGDMLYLMWKDTTSPAVPGGDQNENASQPWLDWPVETVPALVNPAALYKYPGIAIRWHMPPLLLGPPTGGAMTNVVSGGVATWDGTPVATNEIASNLAEWN